MKKIINNSLRLSYCALLCVIISCTNNKEKNKNKISTNEILAQVDTVIAIGKVSAENGSAIIASNIAAIVDSIYVNEGDTVKAGSILFKLKNNLNKVEIALANTKLQSVKNQFEKTKKDIDRERISLTQLNKKYKTSKALFEQNAETKENLLNDEYNYLQQIERIASLQKELNENENQIKEQELNNDKTSINLMEYSIKSPIAGIISDLSIQIGQHINTSETLGEIINTNKIIIEAEVDELYADKINLGQEVTFININTKQKLGKGIIMYSSPTLVNKSILYETANEGNDRRVLPIKIKPSSDGKLLINAKVECQIKIK